MRGSELEDEMIVLTNVTFEREFTTAIRWQAIGYSPEGITVYLTLFSPEDTAVIDSLLGIETVKRLPGGRGWDYRDWQKHTMNDLYVPIYVTAKTDPKWGLRPKAYQLGTNKWITPEEFAKRKEQIREYAQTT
jgi:hypothetical protein